MSELSPKTEVSVINGRLQAEMALEALKEVGNYPRGVELLETALRLHSIRSTVESQTDFYVYVGDNGELKWAILEALSATTQDGSNTEEEKMLGTELMYYLHSQAE